MGSRLKESLFSKGKRLFLFCEFDIYSIEKCICDTKVRSFKRPILVEGGLANGILL